MQITLTPDLLLEAYAQGLFPMADSADDHHVHWVCPKMRGQLSIAELHIPRRLKKTIRTRPYDIRINTNFENVIKCCAQSSDDRPQTWINSQILQSYCALHKMGHAHSIEAYKNDELIGGLYGLGIGGAFFGESMFSRGTDASKITLIHLVARLWRGGFTLLDTQFRNAHLEQFGVSEITHKEYIDKLNLALDIKSNFMLPELNEAQVITEYLEFREL